MGQRFTVETHGRIDVHKFSPFDLNINEELRGRKNHPSIDSHVESIKAIGQLEPIVARKDGEGKLWVVTGYTRVEAIRKLATEDPDHGWTVLTRVIPCTNDAFGFAMALAENIVRNDLSELEKAEGVKKLRTVFNQTSTEVANELGMSQSWVSRMEKLMTLPHDLQTKIHSRELSVEAAFLLADKPTEERKEILKTATEEKVAKVKAKEKVVKKEEKAESATKDKPELKIIDSPKPEKKVTVTKKDVAKAVAKKAESNATPTPTKLVPPTFSNVRKILETRLSEEETNPEFLVVSVAGLINFMTGKKSEAIFLKKSFTHYTKK